MVMSSFILSPGDKIKIHGYVDAPGLENGQKYKVKDTDTSGVKPIYVLESVSRGQQFKITADKIEPYIGSKTYIEVFESYMSFSGYIEVI